MPRPHTGPYARGTFHLPTHRGCDHCHKSTLRSEGAYVKKSALRMIWCCAKCTDLLTASGLELAA